VTDDIVTRLLDFTPWSDADLARTMLEAADEIERLREAGDWLWEAMSRHDNTRECPQCQDMIQAWKEVRGD
jgi:hypothetical protein